MLPFKTLILEEHCNDRWYPTLIDDYKKAIIVGGNPDDAKRLKNF